MLPNCRYDFCWCHYNNSLKILYTSSLPNMSRCGRTQKLSFDKIFCPISLINILILIWFMVDSIRRNSIYIRKNWSLMHRNYFKFWCLYYLSHENKRPYIANDMHIREDPKPIVEHKNPHKQYFYVSLSQSHWSDCWISHAAKLFNIGHYVVLRSVLYLIRKHTVTWGK